MNRRIGRFTETDMEMVLAVSALAWGLWVLNPLQDTFTSTPSFQALAQFGPEWAWGMTVALLGAWQLLAALYGSPAVRQVAAWGMLLMWLFLAMLFAVGNVRGTGLPLFSTDALFEGVIIWRLWRGRLV